jgi:arabidopsis histidine kinase 2/3/4 (cytokinin receptor)
MTGTARGMEAEKGGGAVGLGFLGMDRMRLLLPLPLPEKLLARTLRSQIFSHYLGSFKVRMCWRWMLLFWLLLSLCVSCGILYAMSSQAVERRREALASMCDERARMLQDQFNVSMNHLQALAILVSTFHHSKNPPAIDQVVNLPPLCHEPKFRSAANLLDSSPGVAYLQTTFARYAERTAFERPLTSGVAYAVKVTHAEREQFERRQGWSIKKMYSSKKSKSSPGPGDAASSEIREPAEEYAPVIFAQDAYKHVVSFDMLSGYVSTHTHSPHLLRQDFTFPTAQPP